MISQQQYIKNQPVMIYIYLNWNAFAPATWKRETFEDSFRASLCYLFNRSTFRDIIKISKKGIS